MRKRCIDELFEETNKEQLDKVFVANLQKKLQLQTAGEEKPSVPFGEKVCKLRMVFTV